LAIPCRGKKLSDACIYVQDSNKDITALILKVKSQSRYNDTVTQCSLVYED
jgi:hypothetical protein